MKLFFRKYGEGPPLIILHGLYGISDNWVSIGQSLAAMYTVYIPDLRNHGQSPHSTTHNYPAMTEDLVQFIDEHELERPVLLGHSMGGKVVMHYALEHSSIPSGIIIADISPRGYQLRETHLDVMNAMMQVDFDTISSRREVEELIAMSIPDRRIQLFILKNLYRVHPQRFGWRPNLDALYNNLDEITGEVRGIYPYQKPALFLRGSQSDYIRENDHALIYSLFPAATIETLSNAGHWLHADQPEQFLSRVTEFLKKYE